MKRSVMLVQINDFVLTESSHNETPLFLAVGKVSFRIHSIKTRASGYHAYIIKITIIIIIIIIIIKLYLFYIISENTDNEKSKTSSALIGTN